MKLAIYDDLFLLDGYRTYTARTGFPNADPRLAGLLLNHRTVNGIFDDLNPNHDYDHDGRDDWAFADLGRWDPEVNATRFIEAMPHWREKGVIAFTIGLQGGNPFRSSPPPAGLSTRDVDCGAFEPDGSLRPAFMARLRRILDKARDLDMVPIVNYFYQGGNRRIAEDAIGTAIDNATNWLLENGYDGLLIDLVNECDSEAYWPALQLPRVHEMIYHLKDDVLMFNNRTGNARVFYVGASFTGSFSVAEKLSQLPEAFLRAVDVLFPHGNHRTTSEVKQAIAALRQRTQIVSPKSLPIVYNEDIEQPTTDQAGDWGGNLEHLEACLEAHVSWGNLIRSHQRVPCEDWVAGSDVQRAWFDCTSKLAGEPTAPSGVLKFKHRI